jgi:Amt family ammonium transporter
MVDYIPYSGGVYDCALTATDAASLEAYNLCNLQALDQIQVSADTFWLLWGAAMVFFMQAGFAMLEVGCVTHRNVVNILLTNVVDATLGAVVWYLVGYGFAMGEDDYPETGKNGFIGTSNFALSGDKFRDTSDPLIGFNWAGWLFQWAFAATTATIVGGAVVERVTFAAYFVYASILIGFVYPIMVHAAWSSGGWASAFRSERLLLDCGVLDFAGSGVIHMTGGMAALVGIKMVGPRAGRFVNGIAVEMPQLSPVYFTLGTLVLWFCWYGFNGVSSIYVVSNSFSAARAMVNSTIAGACGCLSSIIYCKLKQGYIDAGSANNGLLAGLVAITGSCAVVAPEGAVPIGIIGGIVYQLASALVVSLQLDDVVDAVPVHFFTGIWGLLAPGFFATKEFYGDAYYADRADECCGVFYGCGGKQLGANFIFMLANWVRLHSH